MMAKISHTASFSSKKHEESMETMRARREEVHDRGKAVFKKTGKLDPMVDVGDGQIRVSRNAFVRNDDGTFTLSKGYKRPYLIETDGTGSFGENVAVAFKAAPNIHEILSTYVNGKHQMDFSFAVVQDIADIHGPLQVPEFEADNLFAEHMKLLIPDMNGHFVTEDYDLALFHAARRINADIWKYGEKGMFVLLLDAQGHGELSASKVEKYLGGDAGFQNTISTKEIWEELLKKWHGFIVAFDATDACNSFWKGIVGDSGRFVHAPAERLLAETQAGLVYITDDAQPTKEGLHAFLNAGGKNSTTSKADSDMIWQAYLDAGVPFSEGASTSADLPKPGQIFQHMTDTWPIGHPRASENPAPGLDTSVGKGTPGTAAPASNIKWNDAW